MTPTSSPKVQENRNVVTPPYNTAQTLTQMDARARDIFRGIVESYLTTGDPVGSRTLSKSGLSLSPASIRNTMADLAQLGLLDAPHISAGRRPTQAGLRLFVDALLEHGDLGDDEKREMDARIAGMGQNREAVLGAATNLLSGLAGGAGIVVTERVEAPLRQVEYVKLAPDKMLVVLVYENGQVENRMATTPPGATPSQLQEASNYLTDRFRGKTLSEARHELDKVLARDQAALDAAAARLVTAGLADWSGEDPLAGRALIVRGRSNLLTDGALQEDLDRVRRLFDDLEQTRDILSIVDLARDADAVKIFIGSENPIFSLSGSSLVVAPYLNAERKVVGALGVIGPTRLNYGRVIPVVDYTARLVSRVLEGGE
jgi:heat-inducible transcriptional repressor